MTYADRMLTHQIERELSKLNHPFTDEENKPAIMQRIAELKAMVDSAPTQTEVKSQPTARELFASFIEAIRHRNPE